MAKLMEQSSIQPLLSTATESSHCPSLTPPSPPSPPPRSSTGFCRLFSICFWLRKRHILSGSKATLTLLMWNIIVGFTYGMTLYAIMVLSLSNNYGINFEKIVWILIGAYGIVALLQGLLYPVWGLTADLCCGRYRVITASVFSIWLGFLLLSIIGLTYFGTHYFTNKHSWLSHLMLVLGALMVIFIVMGTTGFQANAVQFGIDQLLDSPSSELSVFLHWYIWTDSLGQLFIRVLLVVSLCNHFVRTSILSFSPAVLVVIISVLMVLSCCKHQWFHNEPHTHNPYGTVYRVLKFTAKHDKPLRRSAWTYCDNERPTRIEFAKQRFGGPFTTEKVEDVKTFLRILIMLFVLSPVFILQVPLSYIYPIFGVHLGNTTFGYSSECSSQWLLLQSGNLSDLVTVVVIPLYIIFVHWHIPRWMPRILYRLCIGVTLVVASVVSMFGIQVVANYNAIHQNKINHTCLFSVEVRTPNKTHLLGYDHIWILVIPNLLTGIAFPFVYITILEFISAQSPHTMKGLLLGVFYAFRGFFTLIGCVLVFPFAQEKMWGKLTAYVTDCGFYYFLLSIIIGLISVLAIPLAIKWYQYRVRDDRPFEPKYVEEYYSQYLESRYLQQQQQQ